MGTEQDPDVKNITPVGGFPHYGIVNEDFLLIKGAVMGPKKRQITLRKSMNPPVYTVATTKLDVKFIDTASKIGHGKFQTFKRRKNSWDHLLPSSPRPPRLLRRNEDQDYANEAFLHALNQSYFLAFSEKNKKLILIN